MTTFSADVAIEQRRLGSLVAYVVLGAVLVALGGALYVRAPLPSTVLLGLGAFAGRSAFALSRRSRRRARLAIDDDAIVVTNDGATLARVERSEVASGVFVADVGARSGHVLLVGREGEHRLGVHVDDETSGRAILEALELDAKAQRTTFEGVLPITKGGRALLVSGALALGLAAIFAGLGPLPLIACVALTSLLFAWPSTLELAADGVAIKTFLGAKFVPFRDVRAIEKGEGRIAAWLVLDGGARVAVPAIAKATIRLGDTVHEEGSAMLRENMHSAWMACRASEALPAVVTVARGGRSAARWIEALRALRAPSSYRTVAVPREKLLDVLEDVTAPDDARAAAAFVLAKDEAAERRIRLAAEKTASPRLRVALEAASTKDDRATERAIAELADAEDEAHFDALTMRSRSG